MTDTHSPMLRRVFVAAIALSLAALACSQPSGATPTPTVIVDLVPPTVLATTDPAQPTDANLPPAPTQQDAGAPTQDPGVQSTPLPPPPAAPAANADYNSITFFYNNSIMKEWNVEIVSPGPLPTESELETSRELPSYYEFNLLGFQLPIGEASGTISVYPMDNFEGYNPAYVQKINELQALLNQKPDATQFTDPASIPNPLLPFSGSFLVQTAYLPFQNGEGIRYLTEYRFDVSPITSVNYTFAGITYDGKYYIEAVFPVSHPGLDTELNPEDPEAFNANWETYLQDTTTMLRNAEPSEFISDLALLDQMIQSLTVAPPE